VGDLYRLDRAFIRQGSADLWNMEQEGHAHGKQEGYPEAAAVEDPADAGYGAGVEPEQGCQVSANIMFQDRLHFSWV